MSIRTFNAFAVIFVLLFAGCYVDEKVPPIISYSITSPKLGWAYYEDSKIMLALSIDTQEITWRSSVDGHLGEGNHLLLFLSAGSHEITADVLGTEKTVRIAVLPRDAALFPETKTLINYSPLERLYPGGRHYPYFITFDGSIKGFRKSGSAPESRMQNRAVIGEQHECIARDLQVALNGRPAMIPQNKAGMRSHRSLYYELGEKQVFYVPNTGYLYALPHEIDAVLFYSSDKVNVWIPELESIDEALLLECVLAVENSILYRLEQIWGVAADINGDGRLAILVSKTINDEGRAIGFFNPADFYRRETDPSSNAYNPASNEMLVVYIAAPDNSTASYSKESIVATIAHEVTHAITYTHKTWQKEMMGQTGAKREELFLDEGLSHLSEVLCGIGYSGGTVKYLQRYLENTAYYSICGKNIYGQDDSVGMRGIITLFLSWLFWEKGGMDSGGIDFLRMLVNSDGTGWENIGKIAGTKTDVLLEEMVKEINSLRANNSQRQYKVDAASGEPLELFPGINFDGTAIAFPTPYDVAKPTDIGPWTIIFYDPFVMESPGITTFFSASQTGMGFFVSAFLPE
ncbi:MAG: hypothetical protein LBI06_00875 [Treponema sp.]|jgi:hypothetical protein|nr:hypothetical protein [Treponema sp.]